MTLRKRLISGVAAVAFAVALVTAPMHKAHAFGGIAPPPAAGAAGGSSGGGGIGAGGAVAVGVVGSIIVYCTLSYFFGSKKCNKGYKYQKAKPTTVTFGGD